MAADPDPVLQTILAKLETINQNIADMKSSNTEKFASIESKLIDCQSRLDEIPALLQRMSEVEGRMTRVEARLDVGIPGEAQAEVTAMVNDRVGSVEATVKDLTDTLAKINADRAKLSSELLISGLNYSEGCDLKGLALAVFRAVLPDIPSESIVSIRQLRPRSVVDASDSTAGGEAVMPGAAGTTAKSPSLVALLSSGTLAHNIIIAKARHRKLHSSQLSADLLRDVGTALPLQPVLININEFLPPDLHRLRAAVRDAAKRRGFSTFIRNGEVFIKKKKEDSGTRIASLEELENFLQGSQ